MGFEISQMWVKVMSWMFTNYILFKHTHTHTEKLLSRVWLCDPMDCSPPGSWIHGIFQAWILEWVAVSFSKGMDFQDVLWPYHFGANREKDANFAMNFRYPGSHTRWVQAVYRNFPDKHRLTGSHWISPTEKTWWNRCLDVGLPFPVSVRPFPMATMSGEIATEKRPPKKHFQAVCDSHHTECWQSYVPLRKERQQQKVCFQASLYQEFSAF